MIDLVLAEVVTDLLSELLIQTIIRLVQRMLVSCELADAELLQDKLRFASEGVVGVEGVGDVTTSRQEENLFSTRVVVHPGGNIVHHVLDCHPSGLLCVMLGDFLPSIHCLDSGVSCGTIVLALAKAKCV